MLYYLRGANRVRTGDLLVANETLSQLSYSPIGYFVTILCGAKEDRTPDLLNAIQALSQLSYSPMIEIVRIKRIENFKCNYLYSQYKKN